MAWFDLKRLVPENKLQKQKTESPKKKKKKKISWFGAPKIRIL